MDYIKAFKNLNTNNKYSRKSPHKAVLLLTIIELFESRTLVDNLIKYDDLLKNTYKEMWNKVLPNEATFLPEAYLPFWYMQSEGFWHIVPFRGKEDILSILYDTHIKPSESKLKDCVNYAELDEDLYFLMTVQSGRSSLKRTLLETYTTLSIKKIDELSISSDNFIDNSEVAMNKYESIFNSSISDNILTEHSDTKESERRFYELPEDIQYVLNIDYYTFLKNNVNIRAEFKEICPSVFELYNKIAFNPIRQGVLSPAILFMYENYLADLKINLIVEDGSVELIDQINTAIEYLHGKVLPDDIQVYEVEEDAPIQHEYDSQQDKVMNNGAMVDENTPKVDDCFVNNIQNNELASIDEIEEALCDNAKILLETSCSRLPLSTRTINVLLCAKIMYFKDIPQLTIDQVQQFKNCGKKTMVELLELLGRYSLEFGLSYPIIVKRLSNFSDDDLDLSSLLNNRLYVKRLRELQKNSGASLIEKSSIIQHPLKLEDRLNNKEKSREKRKRLSSTNRPGEPESISTSSSGEKKGPSDSTIVAAIPDSIENDTPVDFEAEHEQRRQLLFNKMKSFVKARSPQYIANTINPKEWGGNVDVEEIDTMLKLMPEVEYVPFGLYQLKR